MTEQHICIVEIRYSHWTPGRWGFFFAAEDQAAATAEINRIAGKNLHWFNNGGKPMAHHRLKNGVYESFKLLNEQLLTSD